MVALNNLHDIVQNFVHLSAKEQHRFSLMHLMKIVFLRHSEVLL